MDVITAITSRSSCRAFLPTPVAAERIAAILDAARWAPSGVNTQPWDVAVVGGEVREKISAAILAARAAGEAERPDYAYYPSEWVEPYKGRRRASGLALYSALGIGRDDAERRQQAWYDNYRFFGAPVGLFFFLDRRLGQGAWLDYGMFLQNVMLAAQAQGLATCPQASLADYPDLVRRALNIDEDRLLLACMALGYADDEAPANRFRTEREPVNHFTRWFGVDAADEAG